MDLSDNRLSSVPESFADWGSLKAADLSGNPLDCGECANRWMEGYQELLEGAQCLQELGVRHTYKAMGGGLRVFGGLAGLGIR